MTKSELIAAIAEANPDLTAKDVDMIVSVIFNQISVALARGDRVELRGFGAFAVKRRVARMARNPRTGEMVPVGERVCPFFKTGKELRTRVDRGPVLDAKRS